MLCEKGMSLIRKFVGWFEMVSNVVFKEPPFLPVLLVKNPHNIKYKAALLFSINNARRYFKTLTLLPIICLLLRSPVPIDSLT